MRFHFSFKIAAFEKPLVSLVLGTYETHGDPGGPKQEDEEEDGFQDTRQRAFKLLRRGQNAEVFWKQLSHKTVFHQKKIQQVVLYDLWNPLHFRGKS